jgi:hypothetical protein
MIAATEHDSEGGSMKIQITSRSEYAPLRYEATRSFATNLGKRFIAASRLGESERIEFVRTTLHNHLKVEVARFPMKCPGLVQSEIMNVQVFGESLAGGKIIFDVAKPLVTSLLITDVNAIPCSELTFPATRFYLHFGVDCGLSADQFEIEGAFVMKHEDRLVIDLVRADFGKELFYALPSAEVGVGVSIDISDGTKPILRALEDSITSTLAQNAKTFEEIAALEAKLTEQYGEVIKVPSPVEQLDEHREILYRSLGLIVNTMFYLMAEPEDVLDGWGRDTPTFALETLTAAEKSGTKTTIENTLIKAGYTKVRFVGRRYAASSAANAIPRESGTGKTLVTHVRRGHLRRQAYGEHLSQRKIIFVAPVVVNADKGELVHGRIYDASEDLPDPASRRVEITSAEKERSAEAQILVDLGGGKFPSRNTLTTNSQVSELRDKSDI